MPKISSIFLIIIILLILPPERACYPVSPPAPIYQAFGHHGHVGVDLTVKVGTPVRSVRDGLVIESAEDSPVYGRYLMVLHPDGYASLYAHLSKLEVKRGDYVRACQVIALSGGAVGADGSGHSNGYHLHFEVRPPEHSKDNRHNVDPLWYVRRYVYRYAYLML